MAGDHIRALTARHRIKPTSRRCLSAWQPNPGRHSTYRRGDSVQTTGTSSITLDARSVFISEDKRFVIDLLQWKGSHIYTAVHLKDVHAGTRDGDYVRVCLLRWKHKLLRS